MSDLINDVKNVGSTFTSWDSCMAHSYCKWPVIAGIAVGSLIVLSILWCIFSCLCCGVSLMTACGQCLTCGGCCGACRGGRRRKDPVYHPMPPTPTPYQGYQPHFQPMMYNGPQFATFDAGNKRSAPIHEDSLPAMPSWDNAQTRRVQDTPSQPRGSEVEMERMLPQSPILEYHNSDLGTQRPNRPEGLNNNYYNNEPLSPAPTYATTAPMAGAFSNQQHDRFSPRPQHHDNPFDTGIPSNNAPYPSSRESVQFAAQRSMSPHTASYNPYNSPSYDQPQSGRPPTLLQVGRKPVAGSYREV